MITVNRSPCKKTWIMAYQGKRVHAFDTRSEAEREARRLACVYGLSFGGVHK